jgi:hypothetical protein
MNKMKKAPVLASSLLFILFVGIVSAQLGEAAGKVHFNITVGANQTQQMTIFDSSPNASINFVVVNPHFQPAPNETTPKVRVSPLNGVLLPQQSLQLNITVYMPYNITPGTSWSGVVEAVEVPNQTSGSGATIEGGIAKIISATALPPPPPPAAQPPLTLICAIVVAVAVCAGVAYHYLRRRGRNKAPKRG